MSNGLNVKKVDKLKAQPGRYSDGGNLYLQVPQRTTTAPDGTERVWAGAASWLFRYERAGRERMLGIGALRTFSLDEARERARKLRQQLADGIDPLAARKAERAARAVASAKAVTFEECAQQYYDAHADNWKNAKHRQQFLSTLKAFAHPVIGHLPVSEVDTGLVLRVIEPIWTTKRETASRVRGRIEVVLDFATVRAYRTGDNCARWDGHLSEALSGKKKVRHHPALPFIEMPDFMAKLRARSGVSARALEFLILTAARTGAVIGASGAEVDYKNKTWLVPPERAGAKIDGDQPRRIPLSDRAIAILKELPTEAGNPYLFIGPKAGCGLSNNALLSLLERMGYGKVATAHGFRSSFKDWVSETTNYPNHVSEAALWHAVADKVEGAYRRGDLFEKRRKLMTDWARYCQSDPARKSNNVVSLRSAAE
jgi:integrase